MANDSNSSGSQLPSFFRGVLDDFVSRFSGDNTGEKLLNMGLGYFMADSMETTKPNVGYQGKIPELQGVRQQIAAPQRPAPGIMQVETRERKEATPQQIANLVGKDVGDLTEQDMKMFGGTRFGDPIMKDIQDPRRSAAKGRSYFTDMKYAKPDASRKTIPTEEEAREANRKEAEAVFARQNPDAENPYTLPPAQEENNMAMGGRVPKYAQGGIAGAHKGYYLGGKTDGMADKVPARIDGNQEARLSDGEFVIPADVVSHLGNGNSDAGAQQLHSMMDNVRQARTGNPEQGKQINPQQFMPKMAQGGLAQFAGGGKIKYFNQGGDTGALQGETDDQTNDETGSSGEEYGKEIGTESSLSSWAGDYVTGMLGKGQALGELGYNEAGFAYTGDLEAGTTGLQDQANIGLATLSAPNQMGTFRPQDAQQFMNPYTQEVIDRTASDMRRQSQIDALQQQQQLTSAGAFGGSRDALLRAEMANNLSRGIADMSAEQRAANFNQAMDRGIMAQKDINQYGFDVLGAQAKAGADLRAIDQERIAAEYGQFREQREFPYKQVQYMQSLLQGLPLAAQTTTYSEPSAYDKLMQGAAAVDEVSDYLTQSDPDQGALSQPGDSDYFEAGSGGAGEYEASESELDQLGQEIIDVRWNNGNH